MKILLLEPDKLLRDAIELCLNQCRLKMYVKKIGTMKELFNEVSSFANYSLFIINLKNPTDPKTIDFIRENGGLAPILLIMEPHVDSLLLKTVYYLAYDDIIIKEFTPEEMVYRIYKLCHIWNNNVFFLGNDINFDCKKGIFTFKEECILLGKKECKLLKYLILKSPGILTCDEIISFVYENEIVSQGSIRALVKQLRNKLPLDLIQTVKGSGYQILHLKD